MITAMPTLSKTDLDLAIRYLDDAAKVYAGSKSPRKLNRARLIRLLLNKINNKLSSNEQTSARKRNCDLRAANALECG